MAIKRDFTLQLSKEHDLQLKLDEIHNELSSTFASKESLELQLHEEKIKVATLQDHVKNTEVHIILHVHVHTCNSIILN